LQVGLLNFLHTRFGHVSYEWVCSGQGIPNIYEYLRESREFAEPDWLAEEMKKAADPAPVITEAALSEKRNCELCRTAMHMFVSILGAKAGSFALTVLATGGVYLGGGIPPRILPLLERGSFMESFTDKGRMSGLLSRIPVHVILNRNAALLGAAYLMMEQTQDKHNFHIDPHGAST
jgi:glucokinase